jgi:hypothetical protein
VTELQLGLIGLGIAAVGGVLAYNKWQEHRHRKLAETVLKPHHDDVLLGDAPPRPAGQGDVARSEAPANRAPAFAERVEPSLAVDDADLAALAESAPVQDAAPFATASAAPSASADELSETPDDATYAAAAQHPADAAPVADDEPGLDTAALPARLLDPRLEYVVAMDLVEPVSSRQILQSQREALQRVSKPIHWLGFNERTQEWEVLRSDAPFDVRAIRIGLQLVNRLGPLSAGDLTMFVGAMEALGEELMVIPEIPRTRVLDQAAEIDRFCAAVDLEIGLNLVSRASAFAGTKVRALAEAAGMQLGADGLFTRYDDLGRPQFSLQNMETARFAADNLRNIATHGLTFLLDVPRVEHGERVFAQMVGLARRFADTLQGTLVDDNRQPLGEPQLDHIRREFIGKPQATMASFDLPAGSPQALRLFS